MKHHFYLLALAGGLLSQPARAQTDPATSATATTATPAAPTAPTAVSPSHLLAAENMISALYTEDAFGRIIDNALTAQLNQHPQMKTFETEMRDFMRKYMSLAALKPALAAIYTQEFTEAELLELTRFYQSPTGQKAAAKLPILMQKGMEIGQRQVKEHMPELEKTMKQKALRDQHERSRD